MENEIRWDPILEQWVIIASNRTQRPVLGKIFTDQKKKYSCPFCPDAPEGSGDWIVKSVPNKYPSLITDPEISFNELIFSENMFEAHQAKGLCEVLLYTQDHNKTFGDLTIDNIIALIKLWQERFSLSSQDKEIKYSLIMENRGEIIGVSLSHPHGQMYSFPFIPPKIKRETESSQKYYKKHKSCLFCKVLDSELELNSRVIDRNQHFISFIPYYAKWPFEIHIYPKLHNPWISDIKENFHESFAQILRTTVRRLDGLYGFIMPYVMVHHNAPLNSGNVDYFHYHIEIYPPYRAKNRIKYLAGVELGTNTMINPSNPSENAQLLRNVEIKD